MDNTPHKSGFIAVIGRPNVGKSTLINQLIGQKIAIMSDKPQTTRSRILCVLTQPDAQIVLLDTPGVHKPLSKLGEYMDRSITNTLKEVDAVFFVVDATEKPGPGERFIMERLDKTKKPVILVLNKIDLVTKDALLPIIAEYSKDKEFAEMILADDAEPHTYYTVSDKYFNVCQHTLYGKIWLSVRLQNIINPIGNVNNKLFYTEKEAVAEAERLKKGDEAKKKELLALIDKTIEENEKEARIGGRLKHLRILSGTQLKAGIEYRILYHSELTAYNVRPSRMSECGRFFLTKEGYIISTLPSATYIRTNEIPLYNELRHKEALGKLVDSLKRLKHCIETLCTYKEGMENYHAIVNKIVELKKKVNNEQDRANQWRCLRIH